MEENTIKILIDDDNQPVASVIQMMLEFECFEVNIAVVDRKAT